MRTITKTVCLFLCMGMISCDANKSKVADVAKEFVQAATNGDKVTMYELYPQARTYANLQPVKGVTDADIKVEADGTDKSLYIASLDAKKKLVMKVSDEGTIEITDSYGVLLLDSISYELAAKTGVPSNQFSDITNGQLFSDGSDYIEYLAKRYPAAMVGNLYCHDSRYIWGGMGAAYRNVQFDNPVTNNGDNAVKGEEYSVEIVYFERSTGERKGTSVEKGVDLAPKETHVFTTFKEELYYYAFDSNLYMEIHFQFRNISQAGMLAKYGTFTGSEYNEYEEQKDSQDPDEAKKDDGYNAILSDRKLTESDMTGLSKKDLEIMRNMIYAKHGYKFKRNDLAEYFSKYSWYSPVTNDASAIYGKFSDIEKYNVEFIKKYE